MKKTLLILAAGIGSRFGKGIKQLEPVGPNGEIIIDYSIHDAIEAGFNKIIFIIRHDIEDDFKEVIGNRIENICAPLGVEIEYAFQELNDVPFAVPDGRAKPWGTGHAVLACKDIIDGPFAVINADDYYGKDGFKKAAGYLETGGYALVGYTLSNTLSDNGGVTRGICRVKEGKLIGIDETPEIIKISSSEGFSAESRGVSVDIESLVSMNFWCFPKDFISVLDEGFPLFFETMQNPLKDEYLLPIIIDDLLKKGVEVDVIQTDDKWFGVTYQEDKASVIESFCELYKKGIYLDTLYSDL